MSRLTSNLIYQTIYQVLAVCIPLITSPYISRVLGAEGIGLYSFSYSCVSYFILFALLGVTQYGMRTIAQSKNRAEVSGNFWGIYSFQFMSASVALICYIIYVCTVSVHGVVAVVQGLYLLAEIVNINWLYFGLEQYKLTVTRSIVIKILTTVSIFVFVRDQNDTAVYCFILAASVFLSNIVLWVPLRKHVDFVKVGLADIIKHIKPNLVLFIPVAAASVYQVLDKTLLGIFSDNTNNGMYYNADKLVNIPLVVINGCSNVLMSRVAVCVGKGQDDTCRKMQRISLKFGILLAVAMAAGIAAVSDDFCPIFFGEDFENIFILVRIFCITMVVKAISVLIRSVYLIPYKQDGIYIKAIVAGAVTNLGVNYVVLRFLHMGALGAVLGNFLAETVVMVAQILCFSKETDMRMEMLKNIRASTPYLLFGGLMFAAVTLINFLLPGGLGRLGVKIGLGVTVYVACVLIYSYISKDQDVHAFIDLTKAKLIPQKK